MINIINRLSENQTDLIDVDKKLNQKTILIIDNISNELNKITFAGNVIVYINGSYKSFNFSIDSKDETIIRLIQDVIDKYCQ